MKSNAWKIALLLAVSAFLMAPAFSNDLLKAMDGRWKGEGWAKRTAGGAREVVRCRLANSYFAGSRELVITGKCAVPGKKFDFNGAVSSRSGSDAISGRWANPFGFGSTAVAGRMQNGEAVLNFSAPDPVTKKDVEQQMTWQRTAGGFRIISHARGPGNKALSNLSFRR